MAAAQLLIERERHARGAAADAITDDFDPGGVLDDGAAIQRREFSRKHGGRSAS